MKENYFKQNESNASFVLLLLIKLSIPLFQISTYIFLTQIGVFLLKRPTRILLGLVLFRSLKESYQVRRVSLCCPSPQWQLHGDEDDHQTVRILMTSLLRYDFYSVVIIMQNKHINLFVVPKSELCVLRQHGNFLIACFVHW